MFAYRSFYLLLSFSSLCFIGGHRGLHSYIPNSSGRVAQGTALMRLKALACYNEGTDEALATVGVATLWERVFPRV